MAIFSRQQQSSLLRSLAEELALGLTLNIGEGGWLDATISRLDYPHPDARGYHLNGGRHLWNPIWQQELRDCFIADFLGIQSNATSFIRCDERITPFLSRGNNG